MFMQKNMPGRTQTFEQRIKLRNGNTATYYPVPSKVWYGGDDEINPADLTLAYKIDVYTLKPLDRKFIYVDAKTGKILGTRQEMMHSDAPVLQLPVTAEHKLFTVI